MSKYITSTVIQLEFLKVEEGKEFLVTIPAECDREEFAHIIRNYLHDGRTVLTECHIDHGFNQVEPDRAEYDDPIDMVMNMTDPGMFVSLDDCKEILSEAEAHGWNIDPKYTPQDIYDIYYDLEPEKEDD